MILTFDSEGLTSCPMNETATLDDCLDCKYYKAEEYGKCIYEDAFPEEEDA